MRRQQWQQGRRNSVCLLVCMFGGWALTSWCRAIRNQNCSGAAQRSFCSARLWADQRTRTAALALGLTGKDRAITKIKRLL